MQLILDMYKKTGTLYHGYCIEGDKENAFNKLCVFFENELQFQIKGNTDFWMGDYDSFGIHESREVKEVHLNKSFRNDSRKLYVIKANFFTREAQNALLKVFEEPGEGNHFFILTSNSQTLLPTLRSRLLVVKGEEEKAMGNGLDKQVQKFISSPAPARLVMVKELLDEIADEKKTKSDAVLFVEQIACTLQSKKEARTWTSTDVTLFEELLKCADFLRDRSSSAKMILEHLALIIP